jgi:hypothetical protein
MTNLKKTITFENIRVGGTVLVYRKIAYPSWRDRSFLVKKTVDRVTPKQFSLEGIGGKFRKIDGTQVGTYQRAYIYDKSKDQTEDCELELDKIKAYRELSNLIDCLSKKDFEDVSLVALQNSLFELCKPDNDQ